MIMITTKLISRLDAWNSRTGLETRPLLNVYSFLNELLSISRYLSIFLLKCLTFLSQYFRTPILESNLKVPDGLKTLLDNLESLYKVNGELLNELRKHGKMLPKPSSQLLRFSNCIRFTLTITGKGLLFFRSAIVGISILSA